LKLSVFDSVSEKSQDNKEETVSCREKQRMNVRNFQRGTGHLEIEKIEYHKIKKEMGCRSSPAPRRGGGIQQLSHSVSEVTLVRVWQTLRRGLTLPNP
jgi:hypothetical protein